jgi:hypothetical protein
MAANQRPATEVFAAMMNSLMVSRSTCAIILLHCTSSIFFRPI